MNNNDRWCSCTSCIGLEVFGFYFFEIRGVKIGLNGDKVFRLLFGLLLNLNIRIRVIFGLNIKLIFQLLKEFFLKYIEIHG